MYSLQKVGKKTTATGGCLGLDCLPLCINKLRADIILKDFLEDTERTGKAVLVADNTLTERQKQVEGLCVTITQGTDRSATSPDIPSVVPPSVASAITYPPICIAPQSLIHTLTGLTLA
ncbi:UNVERIFIED_CONTAM: hypothetical protein FKN15_066967 [Acipenser sinensis]